MYKIALVFGLTFMLTGAVSGKSLKLNAARTIVILGGINGSILKDANKLTMLTSNSKEDVFVYINSPGGSVAAGDVFIQALNIAKHRGVTVHCVSTVRAASMAFMIMVNCGKRYAFESTKLLFHPARVRLSNMTAIGRELSVIANNLEAIDVRMKGLISRLLSISLRDINSIYYKEIYVSAAQLNDMSTKTPFILIDDLIGKGIDRLFVTNIPVNVRNKTKDKKIKKKGTAITYEAPIK